MELKQRAKRLRGWLGPASVLAGCCLVAVAGVSQDAASPAPARKTAPAKNTVGATAAPKKHATAPASASKASSSSSSSSSSSAKTRPAAHSAAGQHSKSKTAGTARKSKSQYASARKSGRKKPRGQQKIEPERAQAIQEALIREHYMSGDPTGTWNQSSEDAMRRYQADHGWQSKQVPDSRALISLGLGPSHDHLLNPESAMTTGPNISRASAPVSSPAQSPLSHSAEPGAPVSTNPAPAPGAPAAPPDHDASSPQ